MAGCQPSTFELRFYLTFFILAHVSKTNMDDFQSGEETAFVVDEVSNIIKESIEGAIGGNPYQHNKENQWTSHVVEQCLNQLTKLGKPFKYIATCEMCTHGDFIVLSY